jgi:hypothetical protein
VESNLDFIKLYCTSYPGLRLRLGVRAMWCLPKEGKRLLHVRLLPFRSHGVMGNNISVVLGFAAHQTCMRRRFDGRQRLRGSCMRAVVLFFLCPSHSTRGCGAALPQLAGTPCFKTPQSAKALAFGHSTCSVPPAATRQVPITSASVSKGGSTFTAKNPKRCGVSQSCRRRICLGSGVALGRVALHSSISMREAACCSWPSDGRLESVREPSHTSSQECHAVGHTTALARS